MNKQIEALKIAIKAMERAEKVDWELNSLHVLNILQAIQACKEALAEAEKQDDIEKQLDYAHARGFKEGAENAYKKMEHSTQEPVAWMEEYQSCKVNGDERLCHSDKVFRLVQVLASQLDEWQSLSDDEIDAIVVKSDSLLAKDIARAIEQALKEKNGMG